MPHLPTERGPASSWLLNLFSSAPGGRARPVPVIGPEDIFDEDAQLALAVAHGLAYDGWDGVDDRWENDPTLVTALNSWEDAFLARLADEVGEPTGDDVVSWLVDFATPDPGGDSTSAWLAEHGTVEHLREEAVHRSLYQRREADAHTFGIPRLRGPAKAALVKIQADEYGDGNLRDMHAELFAQTMEGLGLDPTPCAWLDHLPAETLATVNLVDAFARSRRWRGALVGHLAVFEMSSVPVMTALSQAYRRLGFNPWTTLFFDVHVVADAEHQVLAAHGMVAPLVQEHPEMARDVQFGAAALGVLEARLGRRLLAAWEDGRSSLRRPLAAARHPLPGVRQVPVGTDPRGPVEFDVPASA